MMAKQLRLLRLYTGKTQHGFAKEIGVAPSTLAKVEVGLADVTELTKSKVLRKYDLFDKGFLAFCNRMKTDN